MHACFTLCSATSVCLWLPCPWDRARAGTRGFGGERSPPPGSRGGWLQGWEQGGVGPPLSYRFP